MIGWHDRPTDRPKQELCREKSHRFAPICRGLWPPCNTNIGRRRAGLEVRGVLFGRRPPTAPARRCTGMARRASFVATAAGRRRPGLGSPSRTDGDRRTRPGVSAGIGGPGGAAESRCCLDGPRCERGGREADSGRQALHPRASRHAGRPASAHATLRHGAPAMRRGWLLTFTHGSFSIQMTLRTRLACTVKADIVPAAEG